MKKKKKTVLYKCMEHSTGGTKGHFMPYTVAKMRGAVVTQNYILSINCAIHNY